jgi:predicted small lipoprotein YifL
MDHPQDEESPMIRRALLILLLGGLAACGDGPLSESDKVAARCLQLCDAQAAGTGCDANSAYDGQCRQLCNAVSFSLSEDCRATAHAYYACGITEDWECAPGGNLPLASDSARCQDELEVYNACLQG